MQYRINEESANISQIALHHVADMMNLLCLVQNTCPLNLQEYHSTEKRLSLADLLASKKTAVNKVACLYNKTTMKNEVGWNLLFMQT